MDTDGLEQASLPYVLDEDALAGVLERRLIRLLGPLLQEGRLSVRCEVPSDEERRACFRHNLSLSATLTIAWESSDRPLSISFPYPWQGVFLFAREAADHAGLFTWQPYLTGRPGVWRLRQSPDAKPVDRLFFLDGFYVERADSIPDPQGNGARKRGVRLLAGALDGTGADREWLFSDAFDSGLDAIWDSHPEPPVYDAQDLGYQRLFSYGHFLLIRVLQRLYERLLLDGKTRAVLSATVADNPEPNLLPRPADVWRDLADPLVWRGLVPSRSALVKHGLLAPFKPINGIDALSQLCAVRKFGGNSASIDRKPPSARQNHPSFRGWICPVETPESPRVGINLSLARGVEVDLRGHLQRPAGAPCPSEELGHAAAFVPFFHHNDGARAMMGAKNLALIIVWSTWPAGERSPVTSQ